MLKILIMYGGTVVFTGTSTADPTQPGGLGGIEQCVLYLAEALARRGHRVWVSGRGESCAHAGVSWLGPHQPGPRDADVVIVTNDALLLDARADLLQNGALPVVWFHNEAALAKEIRRGRFTALWRWRPVGILLGSHHRQVVSRFLPLRLRLEIAHGLGPAVFSIESQPGPRAEIALFTSQPYRGFDAVLAAWRNQVRPHRPAARLDAYIGTENIASYNAAAAASNMSGIYLLPRIGNVEIPARLAAARVFMCPGHVSETFCLAAAEALALGVPVVTFGTGALRERVIPGLNGIVCGTVDEMGQATRHLMEDTTLWSILSAGALASARQLTWDNAAENWEKMILSQRN